MTDKIDIYILIHKVVEPFKCDIGQCLQHQRNMLPLLENPLSDNGLYIPLRQKKQ